ncbi:MFS transporter [Streptomyces griseorubiginosus]|uniref:MFS transporter n=1 Tax=Streptomyces griseorubiginosus TaxID=67304 RepID=UPI002E807731|nr:MFS transporter [Streptomyces griseorubiginosus]WUB47958.1 MFS transporter [Streptomyces griseorubiginosus]WUB56483.1 MFS transporter [Streptomyces griseorubiginosus]
MTTTWAVLRDRNARLYLAGVLVSGFGTSALWLAAGVWVKDLTGSDGLAALSMLAMWAPTLAGPLLGALADRIRRKPLLIGANLLLAAVLPVLLTDRVAIILTVLFLYGAVGVVHDAAESALVAGAVGPSLLGDFNGLRTAITEGMKVIAPLAGAGLYALHGGPGVALLDALTFVLAAGLYAGLRVRGTGPVRERGPESSSREQGPQPSGPEKEPAPSHRAPFTEGARHIWAHPTLRPLVLAGGTTMFCAGLNGALLYAVIDALGRSPAYAGALYAVQGAGSVAVGLFSGPALRRLGGRRFAGYGIALTAVAAGLRALPSEPLALVCSAAIGAGLPCVLIAALTAVQRETPDALLGRTVATANTLVFAPNVLGLAVGAALVELVDQRPLSAVLGVLWLATAVPLFQRQASAERIASRSPSDANPA